MVRLERFFGNMHCESHGTTSVTSRFMLRRTAREQLTYFEKADGQTLRPFIMMTIMHRTGARRGTIDPAVLVTVLAILFGGCAFIATACAVRGGITQHFDEWLLLAARDPADREKILGPAALEEVARDLTALGGVAALSLVTAAVSGYLLISRKYDALALLLSATLGGLFLSTVLKESFHRPRPTVVPHKSQVITSSFPSGHSLNSAVVYLTLGSLMAASPPTAANIVFLRHGRRAEFFDWGEPRLHGGPLSERCVGGMVRRHGVGAVVRPGCAPAAAEGSRREGGRVRRSLELSQKWAATEPVIAGIQRESWNSGFQVPKEMRRGRSRSGIQSF